MVYIFLALIGAGIQSQAAIDSRLNNLSQARHDFEKRVVETERYEMEEHIYTMPEDQHLQGYYPVGASDRRFLINVDGDAQSLVYQSYDSGHHARTRWRLALRESNRPARFSGTLGRILHRFGADVEGRVNAAQRACLMKFTLFAAYDMVGVGGGDFSAWFVHKDGSPTPAHFYDGQGNKRVPIVDAEAEALGLGKVSWPPDMTFRLQG